MAKRDRKNIPKAMNGAVLEKGAGLLEGKVRSKAKSKESLFRANV